MKKLRKLLLIVPMITLFGCASSLLDGVSLTANQNSASPDHGDPVGNKALKLLGGPGNNASFALSGVSIPGSFRGTVSYEFDILYANHSSYEHTWYFDLGPTPGSRLGPDANGNAININNPISGKTVMIGGAEYNTKIKNNAWDMWINRGGTKVDHISVAKGANYWDWFEFTQGSINAYRPLHVKASWNLDYDDRNSCLFNFLISDGSGAQPAWAIDFPSSIIVDNNLNYYPSIYFHGPAVGDYAIIDNVVVKKDGNVIAETDFTDESVIGYDTDRSKLFFSGRKEKTRIHHSGDVDSRVDFVVDIPSGKDPLILQLTDIQIIDSSQRMYLSRLGTGTSLTSWAPTQIYNRAFKYMRETIQNVIKKEGRKPDIIVLTGDNTYGEFDFNFTSVRKLVDELDSYDIPWCLTYGNHDQEAATGKLIDSSAIKDVNYSYCDVIDPHSSYAAHRLLKNKKGYNMTDLDWFYGSAKNCLFSKGQYGVTGHANYSVGLRRDGELINILYMMDSHGNSYEDASMDVYSAVGFKQDQIDWLTASRNSLSSIPSLGFCHHQLWGWAQQARQYGYASTKTEITGIIEGKEITNFVQRHDIENIDETYLKSVLVPGDNGCFHVEMHKNQFHDFDYTVHNLSKSKNILGWFFGHEHSNNATVTYDGVKYGFGLKASQYDSFVQQEVGGTLLKVNNGILSVEQIVSSSNF